MVAQVTIWGEEFWDVIWCGLAYLVLVGLMPLGLWVVDTPSYPMAKRAFPGSYLIALYFAVISVTAWTLPSWFAWLGTGFGAIGLVLVAGFSWLNHLTKT